MNILNLIILIRIIRAIQSIIEYSFEGKFIGYKKKTQTAKGLLIIDHKL